MYPICGALPLPNVPVRVIHMALVAHRRTYAGNRRRTSLYRRTFILLSVSLRGTILLTLYSMVCMGLAGGFKSSANMPFYSPKLLIPF